MNIIITIPKTEDWNTWLQECEAVANNSDSALNYRVSCLPKQTKTGERCYVVYDGYVRGYHVIDELCFREGFVCGTTGRYWPEGNYIMRKGKFHEIKPFPYKGFQGWRYFKCIERKN